MATSLKAEKGGSPGDTGSQTRERERLLLWALAFLAFRALVPLAAPLQSGVARAVVLLTFMLLSLLGTRRAASLHTSPLQRGALFLAFSVLSLGTAVLEDFASTRGTAALLSGFSDLFLIGAAAMLGHLLAGLFREPNLLVPAAVVAGLVDYWGVNYGTTRAVLEQHTSVVSKLSVQVPLPSLPGVPDLQVGIGFGDFVFMTLFLVCARRFQLRESLTFWLCYAVLLPSMWLVAHFDLTVPALLPMAVAFLIANVGRFRFQRSEAFAMLYAAGFVAALVFLLTKL